MEFKSFKEIEDYILNNKIVKTIALACAEDDNALEAVISAKRKGVVKAILVGNVEKIKELLKEFNENEEDYQIIECNDELEAGKMVVRLVNEHTADIPMKGLMLTSSYMKAILDKETGLISGDSLLSQASIVEYKEENRLLIVSDCAVNISPNLEQKKKILDNAVQLCIDLGIEKPKAAIISALEKVNPKIESTVDADEITKTYHSDKAGTVYGPLAMDIALSKEAALHKGVTSDVCGDADILLMPDLDAGNIFTKGLVFLGHIKVAGTLTGTKSPVIMTSRTDTPEDKYYAILISILQSLNAKN